MDDGSSGRGCDRAARVGAIGAMTCEFRVNPVAHFVSHEYLDHALRHCRIVEDINHTDFDFVDARCEPSMTLLLCGEPQPGGWSRGRHCQVVEIA